MRVPAAWLRAYCEPGLPTAELAERLALAGVEVERVERVGVGALERFVVGRVLQAERHPDADRLTVCAVDDGSGEPRTIVCGAPNVAAGQTVAVALPGAVMPDGTTLGEARLRGVASSGMILAEDEVAVGSDHAGIMVLSDGAEPGQPLADHLRIADEALELETSPNRPDTLAVYGVAREVHAITGAPLAEDPAERDAEPSGPGTAEDHASVEIADPEVCLRFTARVFCDVKVGPSPLWLKQRLTAAGQRPISNVVDITNYVMLLTGQPLHAFDLDEVRGGRVAVRRAREGEAMTTLDEVERTFDREMALVCDAEGPSGIAGVMGGRVSEVSESTTRVLMEAATWVGPNILRTSSALGLRTEASARFEKQLHPDGAMAGQRLAARLMTELCGARLVPGTLDAYPRPGEPTTVGLRHERLERLLGVRIPPEEVDAILGRLGFAVAREDEGRLSTTVPSWRDGDVRREADLIEEVARVHGLDELPATLPARRSAVGRLTRSQALRRRLEDALRDRGLLEVVAYSFTAPATLARLGLDPEKCLEVANPLSEDQSVMRPLLIPGLLDAARRNAAHGRSDVGLFESAHVYAPLGAPEGAATGAQPPDRSGPPSGAAVDLGGSSSPPIEDRPRSSEPPARERHHVAGLLAGSLPGSWRRPAERADYHAARALVEGALAEAGLPWRAEPGTERPFLHPGRSAAVMACDLEIGWIGELHPAVAEGWDLDSAAAFELDADAIAEAAPAGPAAYRDLTAFPAVLQDIAVVVGEETPAAAVERAVRAGAGELLASIVVFDVYRGEQVGEGRKSLALRLEFRAPDRTLTDQEVAGLRSGVEAELESVGGRLRA
ncbi:MAG TPA: phenylalanine--tRNA ligase subunit beta [Thermoleophilaceae bacterium]|nr:phenylalanine--tRNA ligase subunit beta [Thermoleophilaceae bacterium]